MSVTWSEGRLVVRGLMAAAGHAAEIPIRGASQDLVVAAHRGLHAGNAPYENTLGAFKRAIDAGADLLELDVQRTLDGILVVHHDPKIGEALISATALEHLPALPSGEAVTKLRDVVELAADRGANLLVELKGRTRSRPVPTNVVNETVDLLKSRLDTSRFEMFSFDLDAMRAVKELDPTIRTGALFMEKPQFLAVLPWKLPTTGGMIRRSEAAGVDFVALRTSLARDKTVQRLHDAGLPVYQWTADEPEVINRLLRDPRVQGIITDRSDLAVAMRSA